MRALHHNGFKAWIFSEGQKLPVYDVKVTDEDTVTCWIASKPNTTFTVGWRKEDRREVASSGHVFIDGRDVASGIMRPKRTRPVLRSSAKISSTRARPFCFTTLQLTDDEHAAPVHDDAGTIRLEISWVRIGSATSIVKADVADHVTVAHERAKKGGMMITTYAEPERIECGKAVSTRPYYPDEPGPFVTFIFRYHQLAMLQAWGIIANPNPPMAASVQGRAANDRDQEFAGECENSNDEREESPLLEHDFTPSQDFESSQPSSEGLYDMGDTASLFNDEEGVGYSNGDIGIKHEEDEEDEVLTRGKHEHEVVSLHAAADKAAHLEEEYKEPMEDDD